jgi:hypothetical protein
MACEAEDSCPPLGNIKTRAPPGAALPVWMENKPGTLVAMVEALVSKPAR